MKNPITSSNCSYYLIRLGKGTKDGVGDFIDHIDYSYNLAVIQFHDEEILAIQGPNIKFYVESDSWTLPVESLVEKIESDIPKNILMGLYQSAFQGNDSGMVKHDCLNEDYDNFFQTTDQDEVSKYGNSYFAICSVTKDLELKVDVDTGSVEFNGQKYNEISELYGNIDEDEWWVIGVSN